MIEFLFSVLLVPFLPELADPNVSHEFALKELQARLNQTQLETQSPVITESVASGAQQQATRTLPEISGRLFDWSSDESLDQDQQSVASTVSVDSLRLTGLIETSGQYVGILNDGEKDHVVGVGSYVMNAYRVVSLGKRRLVLMPLDKGAGVEPVELGLLPGDVSRGLQ